MAINPNFKVIEFRDRDNDSSVFPITLQTAILDEDSSTAQDLTTYISVYNVSAHKKNTFGGPGYPRYGTYTYTLTEAISMIPYEYQRGGIKITFRAPNDKFETYTLNSSVWNTNEIYWKKEESIAFYYVCSTQSGTQMKLVGDSSSGHKVIPGGSIKIKFTYANTFNNATLNIGNTGEKPLYYGGERATSTNTWAAGETVEVYYDGANYYANNVEGGGTFKSGEKLRDVSITSDSSVLSTDSSLITAGAAAKLANEYNISVHQKNIDITSPRYNTDLFTLEEAISQIPEAYRHGGLKLTFNSDTDSSVKSYILDDYNWNTNTSNWKELLSSYRTSLTLTSGKLLYYNGNDVTNSPSIMDIVKNAKGDWYGSQTAYNELVLQGRNVPGILYHIEVQPDWEETNPQNLGYVKNQPNILNMEYDGNEHVLNFYYTKHNVRVPYN